MTFSKILCVKQPGTAGLGLTTEMRCIHRHFFKLNIYYHERVNVFLNYFPSSVSSLTHLKTDPNVPLTECGKTWSRRKERMAGPSGTTRKPFQEASDGQTPMPSCCLYLEDIHCPVELVTCVKAAIRSSIKHFHKWKYWAGPSSFSDVGQFLSSQKPDSLHHVEPIRVLYNHRYIGFRIQNCDNLPGEHPRCFHRWTEKERKRIV